MVSMISINMLNINHCDLAIAKCDSPLTSDGSGVIVTTGYSDLALEGTNITFNCSSGFLINGPTMARCTGTGQWNPDPREVKCIGNNKLICIKDSVIIIIIYLDAPEQALGYGGHLLGLGLVMVV